MEPTISVIVVNWNGRDFLGECLRSLRDQTYLGVETIVVDNGSTDGSQAYVRDAFSHVRLIQLPKNMGFAAANNIGYQHARGAYIALLNNDTRVAPEWLEALLEALERRPEAGFAASKLVLHDQPQVIDAAGDIFLIWGIGRKRGHGHLDGAAFDCEEQVFGACAGAVLYRRTMLEQIGFFDEDFFAYNEDVDLSFRAQVAGWQCIYVPRAKVWHRVGATSGRLPAERRYLDRRNTVWVVVKNMPGRLLLKYGFLMLAYHLASDLKWCMLGHAGPIIRGRLDALRAWKKLRAKRKAVQLLRKVSYRELESVLCSSLPVAIPKWCLARRHRRSWRF